MSYLPDILRSGGPSCVVRLAEFGLSDVDATEHFGGALVE